MQGQLSGPRAVNTQAEVLEALRFEHGGTLAWGVTVLNASGVELGSGRLYYDFLSGESRHELRQMQWDTAKQAYKMKLLAVNGSIFSQVTVLPSTVASNVEVSYNGTTWYAVPPSGEIPGFAAYAGALTSVTLWVRIQGGKSLPGRARVQLLGSAACRVEITHWDWMALSQLDVRFAMAAADWSAAAAQVLVACDDASPSRGWAVQVSTTGYLQLGLSTDGTSQTLYSATAVVPEDDGAVLVGRVTWRASDGKIQFSYKPAVWETMELDCQSHGGWTQIGNDVSGPTSSLYPNGSVPVTFGARKGGTLNELTGDLFYGQVSTTIGDPPSVWYWPQES